MTLFKSSHDDRFGIDYVGCAITCNPYQGDVDCETPLPVLCLKVDNSPRPAYPIVCTPAAMSPEFYCGWSRGHFATTAPAKGSQFQTREDVDAFCAATFGVNWRLYTWYDSWCIIGMGHDNGLKYSGDEWSANTNRMQNGGWGSYAYGNIRNDTRLWIDGPRDQSPGCWTH